MVVPPAVSVQNVVDLMNQCNMNGIQKEVSQSASLQPAKKTLNVMEQGKYCLVDDTSLFLFDCQDVSLVHVKSSGDTTYYQANQ